MATETFEAILEKRLGKSSGRKVPAYLTTLLNTKGLTLKNSYMEVLAQEGVPQEEIEEQATEAALVRLENHLDGILSEDMFDSRLFTKPKTEVERGKVDITGGLYGLRDRGGRLLGALSLTRLLNLVLRDYVKSSMGKPTLVYRTGRFANSVTITGVDGVKTLEEQQSRGASIYFSYMTAPYSVFESTEPWAQGGLRDPRDIINRAIHKALKQVILPESYRTANVELFKTEERHL